MKGTLFLFLLLVTTSVWIGRVSGDGFDHEPVIYLKTECGKLITVAFSAITLVSEREEVATVTVTLVIQPGESLVIGPLEIAGTPPGDYSADMDRIRVTTLFWKFFTLGLDNCPPQDTSCA